LSRSATQIENSLGGPIGGLRFLPSEVNVGTSYNVAPVWINAKLPKPSNIVAIMPRLVINGGSYFKYVLLDQVV
jgi:hypothetical protein